MEPGSAHSGDSPQDTSETPVHQSSQSSVTPAIPKLTRSVGVNPHVAPIANTTRKAYDALSASSVGLELGLSVIIGLVGGYYLDEAVGTSPLFLFVFLGFGLFAGFRGVLRYVAKADRAAEQETRGQS